MKIALAGTGNVAKRNYIPCLAAQEDVELGYYNRTSAKAEAVAAEFGGEVFHSIFVLTRETDRRDLDSDMEVLDHRSARHETYAIARDRSRWQQYDDSFTKSILAYLETLRQNAPPPVPGLAGLQELQVEAAIKRSIATGRPVDLDADLPLGL